MLTRRQNSASRTIFVRRNATAFMSSLEAPDETDEALHRPGGEDGENHGGWVRAGDNAMRRVKRSVLVAVGGSLLLFAVLVITPRWSFGAGGLGGRSDETAAAGDQNVCKSQEVGAPLCPRLFFLGVQKSASTSLYLWMEEYWPHIQKPLRVGGKLFEMHFFDSRWQRGMRWYSERYPMRRSADDVSIDYTPAYFRLPDVPARIKQTIGSEGVKFMIVLRDPVPRSYARYQHALVEFRDHFTALEAFNYDYRLIARNGAKLVAQCILETPEDEVFGECGEDSDRWRNMSYVVPETGLTCNKVSDATQLISAGMYGHTLLLWYRYFAPEQFCVLTFEKLMQDFDSEMRQLEPCLKAFNKEMILPPNTRLPRQNVARCKEECDRLSKEELKEFGRELNEIVFAEANTLTRLLLSSRHNMSEQSLVVWEDSYL